MSPSNGTPAAMTLACAGEAQAEKPARGKHNKISQAFATRGSNGSVYQEPPRAPADPVSVYGTGRPVLGGPSELFISANTRQTGSGHLARWAISGKESDCVVLPDSAIPSEELGCMQRCIARLQGIARQLGSEWTVQPFGSVANGFGTPGSDLDLTFVRVGGVEARHGPEAVSLLQSRLQPLIQESKKFWIVQEIYGAKIPIIKLSFENRLEVDISCHNQQALRNTRLLHAYSRLSDTVTDFVVAVKLWAKAAQVCGATDRNLSSYAFTLMAVYYLQVDHKVNFQLPCLPTAAFDNGRHGAEDPEILPILRYWKAPEGVGVLVLLRGFFRFFGRATDVDGDTNASPFLWGREVVSVRLGRRERANLGRTPETDPFLQLPHRWGSRIHIEDPFELDRNLHCVLTIERELRLREALGEALAKLERGAVPVGLEAAWVKGQQAERSFLQVPRGITSVAAPSAQPMQTITFLPSSQSAAANAPHSGHLDRDAIAHDRVPNLNHAAVAGRMPLQPGHITRTPPANGVVVGSPASPSWPAPEERQVPTTALSFQPGSALPGRLPVEVPKPQDITGQGWAPAPVSVVPNRVLAPRGIPQRIEYVPPPQADIETLSAEDTDPAPPTQWLGVPEVAKPKAPDAIKITPTNSMDIIKGDAIKSDVVTTESYTPKPTLFGGASQSEKLASSLEIAAADDKGADSDQGQDMDHRKSGASDGSIDLGKEQNGVVVRKLFEGRKWFQNMQSKRVQDAVGAVLKQAEDNGGSYDFPADASGRSVSEPTPSPEQLGPSVADLERTLNHVPHPVGPVRRGPTASASAAPTPPETSSSEAGGQGLASGIIVPSKRWGASRKSTEAILQRLSSAVPQR